MVSSNLKFEDPYLFYLLCKMDVDLNAEQWVQLCPQKDTSNTVENNSIKHVFRARMFGGLNKYKSKKINVL